MSEVSEEEYDPEPINSLRAKHEDIFSKRNTSTRLARNEELLREQELDSMPHGCLPSKSKKYYFYDPVFQNNSHIKEVKDARNSRRPNRGD